MKLKDPSQSIILMCGHTVLHISLCMFGYIIILNQNKKSYEHKDQLKKDKQLALYYMTIAHGVCAILQMAQFCLKIAQWENLGRIFQTLVLLIYYLAFLNMNYLLFSYKLDKRFEKKGNKWSRVLMFFRLEQFLLYGQIISDIVFILFNIIVRKQKSYWNRKTLKYEVAKNGEIVMSDVWNQKQSRDFL